MNTEMNQGHEASEVRKCYHAPELTMLGAVRAAVQYSAGAGADGNPGHTSNSAS